MVFNDLVPDTFTADKEAPMSTTHQPTNDFLAMRQAWIEKGRLADTSDPYWASVLEAEAERTDPNRERKLIEPLVVFG